ncbi:hypothetical protein B0F90DRAFT_100877 [Multifurca ochricompacta]|uniref:Uncharacterized protein n=1 Tax=Multifurca ochricompacta TaxID=376703 RepID=A0AAD4MCS7_9AGAM|nr:hypothetical protein B0F90DRAFT_100877 [Multifurca ochricompacta]
MRFVNTLMPASAANTRVALQVVPPSFLSAIAVAMSLLDSFTEPPFARTSARYSSCVDSSPILTLPWIMPMVAGIAPPERTCRSTDLAVSKLMGYGIPWVTIVVSRATKGRFSTRACWTSGWTSMGIPLSRAETRDDGSPLELFTEVENFRVIPRSIT